MPVTPGELVRMLHVLSAALWFGGMLFVLAAVGPAVRAAGEEGGAFMGSWMTRGGPGRYLGPLGITTLASGVLLYWERGYLDAPIGSGPAAAITVGAAISLVALSAGYAISIPLRRRMAIVPPDRPEELRRLGATQMRVGIAMAAAVGITLLLMTGRLLFA